MSQWISVKDKLPEREVDVLFITKDEVMYVGSLCDWSEGRQCSDFHYHHDCWCANQIDIETVTHWMELPAKPALDD